MSRPELRRDNLVVGTRVIIPQEADLRGDISIGSGTVIHPKATILALQGPISIGSDCIIEETAVIVNRSRNLLKIGDSNLFEVGCRIEASVIGSNNIFEVRSKVASNVAVGSFCTIGAGCTVVPQPLLREDLSSIFDDGDEDEQGSLKTTGDDNAETDEDVANVQSDEIRDELPDRTVVFGADCKRRLWSGEGAQQQAALHAKHLEYLRELIPRVHKLKIVQGVRAPSGQTLTSTSTASSSTSATA
ncbi:trimeric LpxA-like protein [Testicularia cyperi]|uniref:Dynactin subunit 6 n=1 Tax=Testicularia cyperi TaxID=1882483 RepID=A0A317XPP7_9BASI|nr:trimeric LpxA-like protein [Testicularia cyperi]